ncbi:cation:proton antiporter [Schnuerera sp. xch1]|uniref:cation:proton antiporter n=1 Tax=Schnuerera sp. xch1 TaxID=2874283 RepID=UPI001CBD4F8E|nr:cation:proton antiporter [Schnuerera sp. xch1]MBZ2175818.1 cation:proton antiporter [Schnuerera sp. xch1]
MNILFYLAIVLLVAIIMSKIVSKLKLPNVTGYLVAGLIIGPSLFNIIPKDVVSQFSIISEVALAFIAYNIGSEFNLAHLKKMSKGIILITVLQSLLAMVFVILAITIIAGQPVSFGLVLGAIGTATAPAATIMVIRQYKAKGDVVDTLLPVVAMDDAVCVIAFGISASIARALISNTNTISIVNMLVMPLIEVIGALLLGLLMGILLILLIKRVEGETELLSIIIAIIFATAAISIRFNLSSLLACMMVGATLINVIPNFKNAFTIVDRFTPPLYAAFFTISGLELDLSVLGTVGMIGVVYVIFRVLGKISGSYLGARICNAPMTVRRYLGFTLIPQAGVAIGLSMIAQNILPAPYGVQVRTIVLAGTIVFELFGPLITKRSLIKAGEIKTD